MRPFAFVAVAAILFAGCLQPDAGTDEEVAKDTDPTPTFARIALEGWILDGGHVGLAGANVTVDAVNVSAVTDETGYYGFAVLPLEEPLLVVVEREGFRALSKTVTVPRNESLLLNFTLEPVPVKEPRVDVKTHGGFLSCQSSIIVNEENTHTQCGANDPNDRTRIEFTVGPDTVGIVLELAWTAATPLADQLNLTIETVGFGDQDQVLTTSVGASVLRAQVNALQSTRFYSQGGIVRATVSAGSEPDEEESSVGASVHVQQGFELHASTFYVEGPSPTYTALE